MRPTQDDWDEHLDAAEFAINNAWQESVQNTRFMLNSGQHQLTPASMQVEHKVPAAKAFTSDLQGGVERAKTAWSNAQERQAQYGTQSGVTGW